MTRESKLDLQAIFLSAEKAKEREKIWPKWQQQVVQFIFKPFNVIK